ncbi:MAG: DoxX family protein [Acidobacteriia bacterium]|nr:DoxX family protein [Terriglobia bacterium]
MFETVGERRNVLSDWMFRGAIALVFVLAGAEKFSSDPQSSWVRLFQQIGVGQWFRYVTGAVEVLGGVLVMMPWTVTAGLALLACTMAAAALIVLFVIGRPADSVFPGIFFIGLAAFSWNRRRHR